MTGDGRADLVLFEHGTATELSPARVWVSPSTGSGFDAAIEWNSGLCILEQVCRLGDGVADLVAFTPLTGLVWTARSTRTEFVGTEVWNGFFCITGEFCTLGDVDGDGIFDLIAFKPHDPDVQHGNVLWSRSNGHSFGPTQLAHGFFCIDAEQCGTGDFNGDGRTDITLLKPLANLGAIESLVSLSNGVQFINATPFSWTTTIGGFNEGAQVGWTGDVNGDGLDDLLTARSESRAWVFDVSPALRPDTSSSPDAPPADGGLYGVQFFNCSTNGYDDYHWVFDLTTRATDNSQAYAPAYNDSGQCPHEQSESYDVTFEDGHQYMIVTVAPDAIGCGVNDPQIQACQRDTRWVVGGGSFFDSWVIS